MTYGFGAPDTPDDPVRRAEGLTRLQAPIGGYYSAIAEEAAETNPTALLGRAARPAPGETWGPYFEGIEAQPEQPQLPPDELNARFGIEGHLSFAEPMTEARAAEIREIKRRELYRADTMRRADPGFFGTVAGFGVGLVESALDPINFASNFVPVWGQVKWARMVGQAATVGGRIAGRAALGAAQGAQGALLTEALVYPLATQEMRDYTGLDSLMNVAVGTVLGGGLHAVGAGLGEIGRRSAAKTPVGDLIDGLHPEGRLDGLQTAVNQFVRDEAIDVAGERSALKAAMDRVRDEPNGDPLDPLVTLAPGDLHETIVARGGFRNLNQIEVSRSGWGLVKILWRHGDQSPEPPHLRVEEDDILALPQILRDYEPVPEDRAGSGRLWIVEREHPEFGLRKIAYATNEITATGRKQTVVSAFVVKAEASQQQLGVSARRTGAVPASQGEVRSPAMDTAGGSLSQPVQGRGTAPAPGNMAPAGAARKPPLATVFPDDEPPPRLRPTPADEGAAAIAEAAALDVEIGALAREQGLSPEDRAEIETARQIEADAQTQGEAIGQAVTCLIRGGL